MNLVVVGTYDRNGGKPSSIGTSLAQELEPATVFNGGSLQHLEAIVRMIPLLAPTSIVWMPNISNSEDKFLPVLKSLNQKCLLVSSKRAIEKQYSEWDIIGRLLKSKSNLGIMITQEGRFKFKLLDPLGNQYVETEDVSTLGKVLRERLTTLRTMTRLTSKQIGSTRPIVLPEDFLNVVRTFGEEFHKYVNAVNPNRFLGNASTRCMAGFPGYRSAKSYYISRRNVDKGQITSNDFVEVTPAEQVVQYYGDKKPSVDSPIQIKLFNFYKNVNYIIHGHVYAQRGHFTETVLPCGAVEEFEEIKKHFPDPTNTNLAINLRGHGCLLLANNVEYFRQIQFESRPFPECQSIVADHLQNASV